MSVATENFIKTIYYHSQDPELDTKPGSIAKALGISQAATTDMARKLAAKKLIDYHRYRELRLTEDGEKEAMRVLRKHRLWETFLHQTLGISLHEIHREAELLEHQTSDFLASKIYHYLKKPLFDPHGDPIPDENGKIRNDHKHLQLSMAKSGQTYEITRLQSSNKEFFDFCNIKHLSIGSRLIVKQQFLDNRITEITVRNHTLLLSEDLSRVIYVKPVNPTSKSSAGS
jgi:DtxR family Mn-dependent transcriptional regulator